MNPRIIGLCIFLFLFSAFITLSFKQSPHLRAWLPQAPSFHNDETSVKSPAAPNVAFATFLTATMLNDKEEVPDEQDGYFVATRVLAYQLLYSKTAGTNSSIPFIVMCTADVSEHKRKRLEKDGATVIVVEGLSSNWMKPGDPRWADQLTKLRLFELTQYSKICYMDSDHLVTGRMDGIFFDEATLSQQTNAIEGEIKEDEAPLPRTYTLAAHSDYSGYDHEYPPPPDRDYFNCGFLVFSPSKLMFNYYTSLLNLPGRFDTSFMEQNLINYAHRWKGNMPWKPLWYGWNVNWATAKDFQKGARSFHGKYWDSDPTHDPLLKAMWKEQRAEMEGFHRGRDMRDT